MAKQLRLDYPKITAVGRFQNVPITERSAFEKKGDDSGLNGFIISDLIDGKRVPSPERNNAMPISLLEPLTSQFRPLIGTDLAADSALQRRLYAAIVQNSTVAITIPAILAGSRTTHGASASLPRAVCA